MSTVLAFFLNDTSQFRMYEDVEGNCKKFWWRNLLLIQNFYPIKELCMSWSWYIAADFQLYVVTIVLLALSLK